MRGSVDIERRHHSLFVDGNDTTTDDTDLVDNYEAAAFTAGVEADSWSPWGSDIVFSDDDQTPVAIEDHKSAVDDLTPLAVFDLVKNAIFSIEVQPITGTHALGENGPISEATRKPGMFCRDIDHACASNEDPRGMPFDAKRERQRAKI